MARRRSEEGSTLLEVLLAATLTVMVIGAVAAMFIAGLQSNSSTSNRLAESHDAQLLSSYLPSDLLSVSSGVDTKPATATGCASSAGANVVTLKWSQTLPTPMNFVASYRTLQAGTEWQLVRFSCSAPTAGGLGSATPTRTIVGHQLADGTSAWANYVDASTLSVTVRDGSGYMFTVAGARRMAPAAGAIAAFFVGVPAGTSSEIPFDVTVAPVDNKGNVITNYTGKVHFTSTDPQGTVPADYTFTAADQGVHVFPAAAVFKTTGAQSLTVKDVASPSTTGQSTSAVTLPVATSILVSAPGSALAGTSYDLTVSAKDVYGNTVPSYRGTVHFNSSDSSIALPADYTFTLADAGTHVFAKALTFASDGTISIGAGDTVTDGVTGQATVVVQALDHFTVSAPTTQVVAAPFPLTVVAKDHNDKTVLAYTDARCITMSGPHNAPNGQSPAYPTAGSCPAGSSSVTFTSGQATPSVTLYDAEQVAVGAAAGSATGTTASITVSPGAASRFTLSAPSATAGVSFNAGVTAFDAYGNTATSYSGSKTLAWSGPANAPNGTAPSYPATSTFTNGVSTTNGVTLFKAQSTSLTVTQGSLTATAGITVSPGAASKFSFSSSTQTAGTAFNVSVSALDAYGNTATSYSGGKTLTWSGPGVAPNGATPLYPSISTFTNGVSATNSVTLYKAESPSLTVTQGSVTGTSSTFTVRAGAPASLCITNATVPTCSGSTVTVSKSVQWSSAVRVNDAYQNPATVNASTTVTIVRSGSTSFSTPSPSSLTISSGQSASSGSFTTTTPSSNNKQATFTASSGQLTAATVTLTT